jgi:hypothetical protein
MGIRPASIRLIRVQGRPELVENSAAAYSYAQAGVIFTINDSGNDQLLFALDTTGADRGVWRVQGATDVDWEAASAGHVEVTPSCRRSPSLTNAFTSATQGTTRRRELRT